MLEEGGDGNMITGKVHVEDFEDASDEFEYRVETAAPDARASLIAMGRNHLKTVLQTWRSDVLMKQ